MVYVQLSYLDGAHEVCSGDGFLSRRTISSELGWHHSLLYAFIAALSSFRHQHCFWPWYNTFIVGQRSWTFRISSSVFIQFLWNIICFFTFICLFNRRAFSRRCSSSLLIKELFLHLSFLLVLCVKLVLCTAPDASSLLLICWCTKLNCTPQQKFAVMCGMGIRLLFILFLTRFHKRPSDLLSTFPYK